jgi:hypothetical protein
MKIFWVLISLWRIFLLNITITAITMCAKYLRIYLVENFVPD